MNEINYIKNNISKPYLKNIYNILFYESKTQIDFRGIFFEKEFNVNANKNDFVEMNFKIDLEYEDVSERNYVKTIYEDPIYCNTHKLENMINVKKSDVDKYN